MNHSQDLHVLLKGVGATSTQVDGALSPVTDEFLFEKTIQGDREALEVLINRHERSLFGLLVRLTNGDHHRADDLFQETFLHAMRAGKTFDQKKKFKPWITAIAVNLLRDDSRKCRVRREVAWDGGTGDSDSPGMPEPVSRDEGPYGGAERKDEERSVRDALKGLTALEREVVLLHFFNRLTLVETAEVLNVPVGTAKSRLNAALTRLHKLLESKANL